MYAYKIEKAIEKNGGLSLQCLPFEEGDEVEIIILKTPPKNKKDLYPLRGVPIKYVDPTEPVAENDWDVLK